MKRLGLAAIVVIVAGTGTAASASAAVADSDAIGAFVDVGGKPVALDELLAESTLGLSRPAKSEGAEPEARLINWDQWFGCFSLNHAEDVFALYTHWWNGAGKDIRLKCGEGDQTNGWGYKHIRAGKEADWQAKLDGARSAGWASQEVGVESWDDLMSGATQTAVAFPDYKGGSSVANTSCAVTQILFAKKSDPSQIVYSFRVRAAWANNSDRLITSFPQSGETC